MKTMDIFGNTDSRKIPEHLFWGAIYLDHDTAIRGNPEKQNYSVCPRHWYIDAVFKCEGCRQEFTWMAREQKVWFEDYFFWVDSQARHCKKCMANRRHLESLRKEYDSTVGAARDHAAFKEKARIVEVVTELELAFGRLPEKMTETKNLFERQIEKEAEQDVDPNPDGVSLPLCTFLIDNTLAEPT